GEDDAVLDVDAVEIDPGFEGRDRAPDDAGALVLRLLGLQIAGSERAGHRAADREGAHLERLKDSVDRQEIRADGRKVDLAERRRPEAGADGAAQNQRFDRMETGGQLVVAGVPE